MGLRVVGAGLPRTATTSQKQALEKLLGGTCCHMMEMPPGFPHDLGEAWNGAIAGRETNWDALMDPFVASVDFPGAIFWRELSGAYPDALVLLSVRDNAQVWLESMNETVLKSARKALTPDWQGGKSAFLGMMERFTGTADWDHPDILMAAYERHNEEVRRSIPSGRLLEYNANQGWEPLCRALRLPVPNEPFPCVNTRADFQRRVIARAERTNPEPQRVDVVREKGN